MCRLTKQKVIIGNCLDVLKTISDESIDVCVTSPPYWGLRDYGSESVVWGGQSNCQHVWTDTHYCDKCNAWKGQLGLEPSPEEYIRHLIMIFDEVKRVLKPTGACWVNIGDTYATVSGSGLKEDRKSRTITRDMMGDVADLRKSLKDYGYREKSLIQIPSRFAIAMTDNGWILRNECIWYKPNPMPTPVKDRFTVDFEKFFFFTKEPKYHFKQQLESVKEETVKKTKRTKRITFDNTSKWKDDKMESSVRQGMNQNRGNGIVEKRYSLPDHQVFVTFMRSMSDAKSIVEGTDIPVTKAEHWFRKDEGGFAYPTTNDWLKVRDKVRCDDSMTYRMIDKGLTEITYETDAVMKNSDGETKNARCVWVIPTKGESYEHVAMFPKALIKRPIDACCPVGGVVLDPFCGSGTVLQYCFEQDIEAVGIEINPDYKDIITKRGRLNLTRLTDYD